MTRPPAPDRILHVEFSDNALVVRLADDCMLAVPLTWLPALLHALPAARDHWTVAGGGDRILWQDLHEEFSARDFLRRTSASDFRASPGR